MTKLPSFQFYPGDWMKDPALAICSPGARGIWIDVLCLMFESPQRGYLITNHQPWTLDQIARAVRGDQNENLMYLEELVKNGVMKQVKTSRRTTRRQSALVHAFYSARMVQDDVTRTTWRAQKRRQRVENKQSLSAPLSRRSSSSSSSSFSDQDTRHAEEEAAAAFSAIGFDAPFGHRRFQSIWTREFAKPAEWITIKMEACIQECQKQRVGIPPQFYAAKRETEVREDAEAMKKLRRVPL